MSKKIATIKTWIDDINRAKANLASIDSDVNKISTSFICAILQHEGGDVNAYIPSESQIVGGQRITVGFAFGSNTKSFNPEWLKNTNTENGGVRLIMGGFQGSANWWNDKPRRFYKEPKLSGLEYIRRIRGNRQVQVEDFIASFLKNKGHYFRPDLMAINHSRDSSGRAIKKLIRTSTTKEQQAQIKAGQPVQGDMTKAATFAQEWVQSSRPDEKGLMYQYASAIMKNHIFWAGYLGEPDPTDLYILQWTNAEYKRSSSNTIFPKESSNLTQRPVSQARSGPQEMPFHSGNFITPEELRKGIIAQFMNIDDWYISLIAESETKKISTMKEGGGANGDFNQRKLNFEQNEKNYQNQTGVRADIDITERRRYVQSIVEAEFYRRRFRSRSTPPAAGPFNPYPVAGLPGLILAPDRPILGKVESVTHVINVEGATGSTTSSMSAPRYWDEGEVWYYLGGKRTDNNLARQFPQWHNSLVVPTNNIEERSELDNFYEFMIGTTSIDYLSNHNSQPIDDNTLTTLLKNRDPQGFEVSTETLEVKEYNIKIADTDDEGYFAEGTLARKFYGKVRPSKTNRPKASVEEQIIFNERYGVRERELFENFLGNKITQIKGGYTVVYGPTFNNVKQDSGKRHLNQIQQGVVNYIRELESRSLDGGV